MSKLNERMKCRGQATGLLCLPSEAQWEYACRAGTETIYSWGDDLADAAAYAWLSGGDQSANPSTYCHEIGSLLPNAWGFYDMIGSAAEWCEDWSYAYPAYSEDDVTVDPTGAASGTQRITRGGSVWGFQRYATCGHRQPEAPDGAAKTGYGNWFGRTWGCRLCLNLK